MLCPRHEIEKPSVNSILMSALAVQIVIVLVKQEITKLGLG